jgi:hypothetical protein
MFVTIVHWTPQHAQIFARLYSEFVRYRGCITWVQIHELWWMRRDRLDELDSGHYQLCSVHENKP